MSVLKANRIEAEFPPRLQRQFKELREEGWSGTQVLAAAFQQQRGGSLRRLDVDEIEDDRVLAEAMLAQRLSPATFPMQTWLVYAELREEEIVPPSMRLAWNEAQNTMEKYLDDQFNRPSPGAHRAGSARRSTTRAATLVASDRLGSNG